MNMSSNITIYRENNCSIFDSYDWFNSMCSNENWNHIEVKNNTEMLAKMPYKIEKKFGFFTKITSPPLTPYVGPWIKQNQADKLSTKISYQFEILNRIIDQLPKVDIIELPLHHTFSFMHPFIWKNFTLIPRYTYILKSSQFTDEHIWSQLLSKSTRSSIKNAQIYLESVSCSDTLSLYNIISNNLLRKNISKFIDYESLNNLFNTLSAKNQCKILFAKEKENLEYNAAILLVWDEKYIYYLLGGANEKGRKLQALSFLLWEAIKIACKEKKDFDFEGSILKEVEPFIRGFGGEPVVYYVIRKYSKKARFFYNLKGLFF